MSLSREWIPPHSETNGLGIRNIYTPRRNKREKSTQTRSAFCDVFYILYIIITYTIVFVLQRALYKTYIMIHGERFYLPIAFLCHICNNKIAVYSVIKWYSILRPYNIYVTTSWD